MSRSRPFHSIAWITRDGPGPLLRSIESFAKAAQLSGLDYSLFAAQSGQADLIPWLRRLPFHVRLLDRPRVERWAKKIKEAAGDHGIEESVIDFALQIGPEEPSTLRNTGANRNTLLLAHVDDRFLSCDDDVVFQIHRQPDSKTNETDAYRYRHFSNPAEMSEAKESAPILDLREFLSAHESLLGTNDGRPGGKVALTVSGIVGDSGCASPRFMFELSDEQLRALSHDGSRVAAAAESRLLWREPSSMFLSPSTPISGACMGFSNELCLPPFFPLGRNQDGAYVSALRACLRNVCVAHLNQSITHDPKVERAYEGPLGGAHLRINDFISLIWEDLLVSPVNALGGDQYLCASLHFLEYSGRTAEDFLGRFRGMAEKHLKARARRIQEQISRFENQRVGEGFEDWKALAEKEILVLEEAARHPNAGLPREVLRMSEDIGTMAGIARGWIIQYSKLLAAWPTLRQIARDFRPFEY